MPRPVLIITSWTPPMIGGPRNLYNLLSQFPPRSYSILTGLSELRRAGIDRDAWLSGRYQFFDHPAVLDGGDPSRPLPAVGTGSWETRWQDVLLRVVRKGPLYAVPAQPVLSVNKIRLMTRAGVRAVRRSGASVIVGISDHGPALISSFLVSRLTGRPYVLYLYDLFRGNNLHPFDAALARIAERRIFHDASTVILTNEGTEAFYRRRYGAQFRSAVVHNSVFPEDYERQRTPYRPHAPFTLVFTGHVYWPQEQAVRNLLSAMDRLRDLAVRLDLYVPRPDPWLTQATAGRPNVRLLSAPQSAMADIQSSAALLVLPLSWNTRAPDIIATATPGKFTDYLASGRPMLLHAPDYAYVTTLTRANRLGLVVDRNDPGAVAAAIRDFLASPERGQEWIRNSLALFYANHDARRNADTLMSILGVETPSGIRSSGGASPSQHPSRPGGTVLR